MTEGSHAVRATLTTLAESAGICLIAAGFWLILPPLGLIAFGIGLIAVGVTQA